MTYEAVVIGASAGGIHALLTILPALPKHFPLSLLIAQHMAPSHDLFLVEYLDKLSSIHVKEAEDKEVMQPGVAYLAPGGYHLLVEDDRTLSLDADARVRFSRPSIDVLFESASEVFREALIGIILTGANDDGSRGLKQIEAYGGFAMVQDPETAESNCMPIEAIKATKMKHILPLNEIASLLCRTVGVRPQKNGGSNETD